MAQLDHGLFGFAYSQGDVALDEFTFKTETDQVVLGAECLECLDPSGDIDVTLLRILPLDHLEPVLCCHLHVPARL